MTTKSDRCGAKTRRGGSCQAPPMKNGRCRVHGGKSRPPGPGHHAYKHGRQSKLKIPEHLQERIKEELANEHLLNLREDIATIRVRSTEVLSRLGELADLDSLDEMLRITGEIETALDSDRSDEARARMKSLRSSLEKCRNHEHSWSQFERLTERRRRLVSTERDQSLKAGQLITVNQAILLMDRLVSVVVEHVTDPLAIESMQREYAMLVGPAVQHSATSLEMRN